MYASSSFYGPDHPTVEQQFELARWISNSLSDISNQQSKGQSMYVNRKKRSVKWVHEGNCYVSSRFFVFRRKSAKVNFFFGVLFLCCVVVVKIKNDSA